VVAATAEVWLLDPHPQRMAAPRATLKGSINLNMAFSLASQ
jgi:hypothetical protein